MKKELWKALKLPLILLLALLVFISVYQLLGLPNTEELIIIIRHYFDLYGYPVLFISTIIESIPPIYVYYPGSSVILLAAAFSRQGSMNIFAVVSITAIAMLIAFSFNYFIGYHGYYRILKRFGFGPTLDATRKKISKHGKLWIWLSFFHPNFGALTATTFGILKLSYKKFILHSIPAAFAWCAFWGAICYASSEKVAGLIAARWFVLVMLVGWIIIQAVKVMRKNTAK